MKSWVKFEAGEVTQGPIAADEQPEGFVEYVELINLPPGHGPTSVTIALIDGRCVKTISATTSYAVQRQNAYPTIGDQLDMFWHAMDGGVIPKIEPFYTDIANIKAQYPKPPSA